MHQHGGCDDDDQGLRGAFGDGHVRAAFGPDPSHRPSRTTDIERLTKKFATGIMPTINSVHASSVAPMRKSSQSSTKASEITNGARDRGLDV